MEEQMFTTDTLAQFDGREGRRAYVAHAGKVYDVTESVMWKEGDHQGGHAAGVDLTSDMDGAPHFPDELDSFPAVGVFEEG